jgi:hypothetical protein
MEITADFNDSFWEPPQSEFQPLIDFENEVLSEVPHNDISLLTQRIKRSFLDYVRQGIMLDAVRRYRLYKRSYRDFAEYCKLALGRSPFYCKRIIQAAEICLRLIKAKFKILPTSVAQALPLVKFSKVDEYGDSPLEDKWQTVLGNFPPENITAAKIAEAVDENPESRLQQVRIKKDTYALLAKKAAAAGLSFSELLDRIADEYNPQDTEEPTTHTPEQQKILDQLDAEFQKDSAVEAIGQINKPIAGSDTKKLSRCHQKAITMPANRSDQVSDSS